VQDAFERSLTTDETRVLPAWLDTAWRILKNPNRGVPGLEARLELEATDPASLETDDVIDVLVSMVIRKLRNPDGLRSWGGDDYQQVVDQELSAGKIYLTDDERLSLMPPAPPVSSGVFSLQLDR